MEGIFTDTTRNRAIHLIKKEKQKPERVLEYPQRPKSQALLDYLRKIKKPIMRKKLSIIFHRDLSNILKDMHVLESDGFVRKFTCPTCGHPDSVLYEAI